MVHYLKNGEINKQKWDECIRNSFNGIVYAYSWYLDIVCEGWDGLVEDNYTAVMPLTKGRKFMLDYLYQPYFTQQSGVFSNKILSEEIVNEFLNSIPSKYKLIEINLNLFNKTSIDSFNRIERVTYQLDLINSYDNIYKSFSTNNKRNIKKAEAAGLKICRNSTPEEVIELFRRNASNIKGLEVNNKVYAVLKKLIYALILHGHAHIWTTLTSNDVLCGGAFFVQSNNKIIFLFSATDNFGKENGAMSFLISSFIKENSMRNLVLDFEGSNIENLARFYSGFGAKKCTYLHLQRYDFPYCFKKIKDKIGKILH
ncbi:MAG: hypothetical protein Q8880_07760 [Bacteroidota bacterium]|nr:hypothetical protein [Bacteroidota bacterium]